MIDRGISDHFLISIELCLLKPKKQLRKVISRKMKGINISKFRSDVSALLWQSGYTDLYSHYTTCLRKLLDIHAPLTTRLVSDRLSAPWMSKEIQIAKRLRRRAERKYRQTGLEVHRQSYTQNKNYVNRLIRDAKSTHLRNKIESADSSRVLFKITTEMLGNASKPVLPLYTPAADLPDSFNNFFIERITKIRDDLDNQTSLLRNESSIPGF